jgi:4-diphosphocytidyl-2-C-methyl-D-erythritol kinase
MISFPSCKINLGLRIVAKRSDGYHEIETCFYPVPFTDILEIIPSSHVEFSSSGLSIPGSVDENLCLKAYNLLKEDFNLTPVKIHLHKVVPIGAGLGGGSSDAAHALRMLNAIFNLKISVNELKVYAARLGSDCSFFIEDAPMLGTGRGELLSRIEINLRGKFLVLVIPDVHISTAEAYALVKPRQSSNPIKQIVEESSMENWRTELINDFESSVFATYPVIRTIKEKLYDSGAVYSSMSGSGSAVFGIFESPVNLKDHFARMTYWSSVLP